MEGMDRALPATAEEHESYVRASIANNRKAVWFGVELLGDGRLVGVIWLWDIDWRHRRAEVRVLIDPACHGKGLGHDAVRALGDYAFKTLGLHKIYAYVHARNGKSGRVFERSGFQSEALLKDEAFWDGRFGDVVRFARFADRDS
jgi:diamine N-acetyltransferase